MAAASATEPDDQADPQPRRAITAIVHWYFRNVFRQVEGPGVCPFYCDPRRIGHFAASPAAVAAGDSDALLKVFISLSMFQARRDVLVMTHQRRMAADEVDLLSSSARLKELVELGGCPTLRTAATFDEGCSVNKSAGHADCTEQPRAPCHVKHATHLMNRMGDMGKLPTSTWLHVVAGGRGFGELVRAVVEREADPHRRAGQLVERLAGVYRVGEKLATLFVSAMSVPDLAPGLTPWFPDVDGHGLVIVDTHVARAVDQLRGSGPRTYKARAAWLCTEAASLDLRAFDPGVPAFSPRLVQQALYSFASRSNRVARADDCSSSSEPCGACVPSLCPFAMSARRRM